MRKIGVFDSKQSYIMQNFYHNIGFCEKRHFFAKNWQKSQRNVIITSTPGERAEASFLQCYLIPRGEVFP
jgi:hypothetical protein